MRLNELPGSSDFLASTTQIVGTRVFFLPVWLAYFLLQTQKLTEHIR